MRIGAYQFAVTGNIAHNMERIRKAVGQAAHEGVQLLAFPECALTGYPPRDVDRSSSVRFDEAECACGQLRELAVHHAMHIIAGTITRENGLYYNSALLFTPRSETLVYHKRALWGWDRGNFHPGAQSGIFDIGGLKVGIRICFEVRFPEFFRELYRANTDLNIILFYDVSDCDDMERYQMIEAHIKTRAVENVTHTLSVNSIRPYQTAPTALYNKSGYPLVALNRNEEGLLVYDFENMPPDFGEEGRKQISDWLTAGP